MIYAYIWVVHFIMYLTESDHNSRCKKQSNVLKINFGCKLEDGLVTVSEVKSLWNLKGVYVPVIHCFDVFLLTCSKYHRCFPGSDYSCWCLSSSSQSSSVYYPLLYQCSSQQHKTWKDVFRNLVPLFGKEINRFGGTFLGRKKFMPFKSSLFIVSVAILAVRIYLGVL